MRPREEGVRGGYAKGLEFGACQAGWIRPSPLWGTSGGPQTLLCLPSLSLSCPRVLQVSFSKSFLESKKIQSWQNAHSRVAQPGEATQTLTLPPHPRPACSLPGACSPPRRLLVPCSLPSVVPRGQAFPGGHWARGCLSKSGIVILDPLSWARVDSTAHQARGCHGPSASHALSWVLSALP